MDHGTKIFKGYGYGALRAIPTRGLLAVRVHLEQHLRLPIDYAVFGKAAAALPLLAFGFLM